VRDAARDTHLAAAETSRTTNHTKQALILRALRHDDRKQGAARVRGARIGSVSLTAEMRLVR
jgi:hypothetical protein